MKLRSLFTTTVVILAAIIFFIVSANESKQYLPKNIHKHIENQLPPFKQKDKIHFKSPDNSTTFNGGEKIQAFHMLNNLNGFKVKNNIVFETNDGGESWNSSLTIRKEEDAHISYSFYTKGQVTWLKILFLVRVAFLYINK